jgi:hypothetical protein
VVVGDEGREQQLRLGARIANQRFRAPTLTPDRQEQQTHAATVTVAEEAVPRQ